MKLRALCVVIPALVAVVASAGAAFQVWQGGPLTVSEAAALRDQGEVTRLIASGADPNATYPLRPGVLAASSLTPLDAAVGARRQEMVDLLIVRGARLDAPAWRRLHCFALNTGAADVIDMLDRYKPADASASCAGISTPF